MTRLCGVLLGCLFIAGCSDPMDATERNFANAINIYLEGQPECIALAGYGYIGDSFDLPVTISKRSFTFNKRTEHLDGFVDAGLLQAESKTSQEDRYGMSYAERVYDLSDLGSKYFQKEKYTSGYFCYGKKIMAEILQFTEPGKAQEVKVVRVKYTYTVKDIPDWVKSDLFSKAESEAIASDDKPIEADINLFLTSNGWTHDI